MHADGSDFEVRRPVTGFGQRAIIGPIAVSIAFVMELSLVPLLLPAMQAQLGLSIGQLAWVFNAYGIAVAVGVLLGGWFGDVFNPRSIFGAGAILFAAGSLLVAYATSVDGVVLGRAVQGLGGGIFSPLVPVLLTRAAPLQPGKVLIFWGSVTGFVAAFAPLVYSWSLYGSAWDLAFVVLAIVALLAIAILPGAQTGEAAAAQPRSAGSVRRFLRSRRLFVMYGYVFFTYGAITLYLFKLPVWLADRMLPSLSIGVAVSLLWLSFSSSSALLRNRVDEAHVRTILLAAPITIAAGFGLIYVSQEMTILVLSAVLVGFGLACSNAPSTQKILEFAPDGLKAVSVSLDITFARLGGVATVAVLAEAAFGYTALAVALMCGAAFLCAIAANGPAAAAE